MKHLIWLPLALALVAGATWVTLRGSMGNPHTREVVAVGAIAIFSTLAAMLPITLARNASAVPVFQAALGGTVIHLFVMIGLGGAVYALHGVTERSLFPFLLLGFYWISLIGMIFPMVRIFRTAAARGMPPAANSNPASQSFAK